MSNAFNHCVLRYFYVIYLSTQHEDKGDDVEKALSQFGYIALGKGKEDKEPVCEDRVKEMCLATWTITDRAPTQNWFPIICLVESKL